MCVEIRICNHLGEIEYFILFDATTMHGAAIKAGRWLRQSYGRAEVQNMNIHKRSLGGAYRIWEIL